MEPQLKELIKRVQAILLASQGTLSHQQIADLIHDSQMDRLVLRTGSGCFNLLAGTRRRPIKPDK
jgi:hypothetical protein